MPTIGPSTGVPSVAPDVQSPDDYQQVDATAGKALAQTGQSAVQLGSVFGKIQADNAINNSVDQVRDLAMKYQSLGGEDAVKAAPQVMAQMKQIFQKGGASLGSLDDQEYYNQSVRSYQERLFEGQIQSHMLEAQKQMGDQANQGILDTAVKNVAAFPTNDDAFDQSIGDATKAAVQQTQLEGNESDNSILMANVQKARAEVYKARAQALGVTDPGAALAFVQKNQTALGADYAPIADDLRTRAAVQDGSTQGYAAAVAGLNTAPAAGTKPSAPMSLEQVQNAIIGNESGGNPNVPNSVQGAVGPGQIEPATFAQVAQPGQDINNPADNLAASHALVQHYYQQYGGDAARVAVAYFSGPGNVAPAGSPTPWINDYSDKTGTTVSAYVQKALGQNADPKQAGYANLVNSQWWANATPQARDAAISTLNQTITAQQIAQQGTQQARDLASQNAANNYMTTMLTSVSKGGTLDPNMLQTIAQDPNLNADAKKALFDYGLSLTGGKKTIGYGPGYNDTLKAILAPYNTPGKITDPIDILRLAAPGGSLTPAGAQSLVTTLASLNSPSDVNNQGIAQAKSSVLDYAKSKLFFGDDPIFMGKTDVDPQGERAYLAIFVPQYEAAYNAWVKAGKNPMDFLNDTDAVDKMIAKIRPEWKMNQDKIAAENGLSGDISDTPVGINPNTQVQPPPQGISPNAWNSVINDPPPAPWTSAGWSVAVKLLMSDPKTYGPKFDQTFGGAGITSAGIIQQLSTPQYQPFQVK